MTGKRNVDPPINGHRDHPSGQNKKQKKLKKRFTIGYLAAHTHLPIAIPMWSGIVSAAQNHDVNLICFPGGILNSSNNYEVQHNLLYELVNPTQLDGLISWASTLGQNLTSDENMNFHRRFQPLPLVTLTQPLKGNPTLFANTYLGMREIMIHLIEVHGYRRLGFIRGPEGHSYAEERYRAYQDVLKEYGIPLRPELVTPPLSWSEGAEAAKILLDERQLRAQLDFEVLVAANDQLALNAMKVFQARRIRVPEEVAFTGFDDTPEGRTISPALTSAMMPFVEQGERAIEVLLTQLAGEPVAEQIAVVPQMVVRQSCGCRSHLVTQAAVGSTAALDPLGQPGAAGGHAWLQMLEQMPEEAADWLAQLKDALMAELMGKDRGYFLLTLEQLLRQITAREGNVVACHGLISILRGLTLPNLSSETRLQAEDLWGQARVLISEMVQQNLAYQQLQANLLAEKLRDLGQTLIAAFDLPTVLEILAERLPALGIPSCYLSLYTQPEPPFNQAQLVLAYNQGERIELEPQGRPFLAHQLAPKHLLPQDRRYSMILKPLYFQKEQLGLVLFEIGPRDGMLYEVLREQISVALHSIFTHQQREQAKTEIETARREAERALTELQIIQQRYLREAWQAGTRTAGAIQGYIHSVVEAGPTETAWLPAMASAVQQMETVSHNEESTDATLALPIKVYDEIIGVLGFSREDTAQWEEREITIVETIAEQVGLALENQRLFDEVQQTSQLLDKRITELDCLNDIGHEMGEASSVTAFLQWVTGRIPTAMQYPDLCRVAIEFEGQVYGAVEALSLPCQMVHGLRGSSQLFGRIYIAYTEKHDFLNEESALLGDIARRVSVYVENNRLLEQAQTRAHREQILREVMARVHTATDVDTIMRTTAQEVGRALGRRAFVYLGSGDSVARLPVAKDLTE